MSEEHLDFLAPVPGAFKQPHLTPAELATITGVPLKNVKAALQRTALRDKRKSRAS